MRELYYTSGSPFARAVRIILDEKGLAYERREEVMTGSVEERAKLTPTLQVPTFIDGEMRLWDSLVIAEYLMAKYPNAPANGEQPFAKALYRSDSQWSDKLLMATIITLGESIALVSQMRWAGVTPGQNEHVARNAARVQHLAAWIERQLPDNGGLFGGEVSAQDVFLVCFLMFVENRPIEISWRSPKLPRIAALCDRLQQRPSFRANPILWWEPGIVGYKDGEPIYG